MNKRLIAYTLGWVLNIEAACMVLPLICAVCYGEWSCFGWILVSIAACLVFGIGLTVRPPENKDMYSKEGLVTVALSWVVMSLFGALPFFLSGTIPNFINAFFETVSGFTTTGASVLTDVEMVPKSMMFWRSFTHWIGGMGVLVFLVAILPLSGGGNFYLMKAESPGPSVSKIVPKVRQTAKIFYTIYLAMTAVMVVMLLCGGMDIFYSLTITFGTAGTGGFGLLNSGMATYTPYVQIVVTVFMILFGIDFSLYYLILIGKIRDALKSEELHGYLSVIFAFTAMIAVNCYNLYSNIGDCIRHSAFQVASIITTTGYSTTDFDLWPEFSKALLVALMCIGACAGSTGGGIKVSRFIILIKSIIKEIRVAAHPKSTLQITMNGKVVERETVRAVNVYMGTFIILSAVSLLIISLDNFDFTTNFTAVMTTINNVGPGLAGVGPTKNFDLYSDFSTLILSFNMLIGRLEIFPMLVLFSPRTWRK